MIGYLGGVQSELLCDMKICVRGQDHVSIDRVLVQHEGSPQCHP